MAQRAIDQPYWLQFESARSIRTGNPFIIFGRDGDDDEETDEDDGDEDEDEDGNDGSADRRKDENKGLSAEEAERLRKRMKAADKNASELAARLKEFEDKDKGEVDKATERAEAAEAAVQERDETISELRLQNAFLASNEIAWDDPEYALDFANRRGYLDDVRDEDGSVDAKALKSALARLAKDKPSMIKKDSSDKDEDEDQPPSGGTVGRKTGGKKGKFDEETLRRKYPALNR